VAAVLGPAFVAAVAYVDPGNFAVNIGAGGLFGYRLAWVVVLASLLAMPVQFLAAKIGIVTGQSLPQLCRDRCGPALGVLSLQLRGHRPFERATIFLLLVVFTGFGYDLLRVGPDARLAVAGLVPALPGQGAVLLAVSIVGATIMPHVVYLHSALTATRIRCHSDSERAVVLRYERWDVICALGLAGLVNLAMLLIAAKAFHVAGHAGDAVSITQAHASLADLVGGGAALAFAVALLASGLSSASVGTFAGQAIMEGFLGRRGSVFTRRGITLVPALAGPGLRSEPDPHPRPQPGDSQLRDPVRPRPARLDHAEQSHHGRVCHRPLDDPGDVARHRDHYLAQRRAAMAVCRLSQPPVPPR
jgi:manganese transport protein